MTLPEVIRSAYVKDFVNLKESTNKVLAEKVMKSLEEKKHVIAQSYFGKK